MRALHSDTCSPLHLAQVKTALSYFIIVWQINQVAAANCPEDLESLGQGFHLVDTFDLFLLDNLIVTNRRWRMSKKMVEVVEESILLLPQQHLLLVLSLVTLPFISRTQGDFAFLSPGKTSDATASSSDPATCPGGTPEPLTNGHTVESKKNN